MMLELRNIYKTYLQGKLEVPVLKNISLSVEEGEYVAIMGPSGSGKTTLMNIIGCLDNPTSGDYLLEGVNISQNNDSKMSEVRLHSIGFVFQSFYLLSRESALENVALPLLYAGVKRQERLEIARHALERVGLGDRTGFKPTQLSGGQCQRVAIARAIVNNPKILLADEPTGALDTKSGEQIMEIFRRLNEEGVTIVMITHEPDIAKHAHRTLHIRDGRLMDEFGNFINPVDEEETVDTVGTEPAPSLPETVSEKKPPVPKQQRQKHAKPKTGNKMQSDQAHSDMPNEPKSDSKKSAAKTASPVPAAVPVSQPQSPAPSAPALSDTAVLKEEISSLLEQALSSEEQGIPPEKHAAGDKAPALPENPAKPVLPAAAEPLKPKTAVSSQPERAAGNFGAPIATELDLGIIKKRGGSTWEKEPAKQNSVSSPSEKETHRPQGSFHTPIRTELSGLEPGSGKRGGTTPASNRERDKA